MEDENAVSHIAMVRFEIEQIIHELGFPPDTKVRSFWHDRDSPLTINIAVIHPELPTVREGEKLPEICPLFTRENKDGLAKLVGWGHPHFEDNT